MSSLAAALLLSHDLCPLDVLSSLMLMIALYDEMNDMQAACRCTCIGCPAAVQEDWQVIPVQQEGTVLL
jgi:hypothetical protein